MCTYTHAGAYTHSEMHAIYTAPCIQAYRGMSSFWLGCLSISVKPVLMKHCLRLPVSKGAIFCRAWINWVTSSRRQLAASIMFVLFIHKWAQFTNPDFHQKLRHGLAATPGNIPIRWYTNIGVPKYFLEGRGLCENPMVHLSKLTCPQVTSFIPSGMATSGIPLQESWGGGEPVTLPSFLARRGHHSP